MLQHSGTTCTAVNSPALSLTKKTPHQHCPFWWIIDRGAHWRDSSRVERRKEQEGILNGHFVSQLLSDWSDSVPLLTRQRIRSIRHQQLLRQECMLVRVRAPDGDSGAGEGPRRWRTLHSWAGIRVVGKTNEAEGALCMTLWSTDGLQPLKELNKQRQVSCLTHWDT